MADEQAVEALVTQAASRRTAAAHVRTLAFAITDHIAREGLAKYAEELEAQAEQLDIKIVALTRAEQATAREDRNVVPFKPSREDGG